MISYWEKTALFGNPDLVIVGGGIVGISSARAIKQRFPHWDVLVLERGLLPSGATTRNAGFACFGSVGEIAADMQHSSFLHVLEVARTRYAGLELLRSKTSGEDIGYQATGGYEVFWEGEEAAFEEAKKWLPEFNAHLFQKPVYEICDASKIKALGLKECIGVIYNPLEAALHSGKLWNVLYKKAISEGIRYHAGMELMAWSSEADGVSLEIRNYGVLQAGRLLCCTNGFARELLQLDVKPARGQIIVTSPIPGLKLSGTFHHNQGYDYFRNLPDNRVLIGGGRNLDIEGESTSEHALTPIIQQYLKDMLNHHILSTRSYEIEYAWAGTMGVGEDKNPIIQAVEKRVFVAVKMGGMGVAIGTQVGEDAAGMIAATAY